MRHLPGRAIRRVLRRAHGFVLLVLLWPAVGHAAKTDVVTLRNGDRITGEVKGLSRGKLDYSTDDAGRLSIEWVKVMHIKSAHFFELEVASGAKYFGRLSDAGEDGTVVVEDSQADSLTIPSVVRIAALDAGFLQRVRAYLDVGFTFAKANQATTFNLAGDVSYRGDKIGSKVSLDSYAQGQEASPTTTRNTAGLQVTRYLPNRWSAATLFGAEQNDELDLALRWTVVGAAGRVLSQSNSSELGVGGGLAVTTEEFTPTDAASGAGDVTSTSLELAMFGLWDAFRFDSPKLDFSTSLSLFPSLSTLGRIRGEITTRLKYELLADFNVGITATDTFDSKPPEAGAPQNDFITSFTIGWSYRR